MFEMIRINVNLDKNKYKWKNKNNGHGSIYQKLHCLEVKPAKVVKS